MARSASTTSLLALSAFVWLVCDFNGFVFVGNAHQAVTPQASLRVDPSSAEAGVTKEFYDDREPLPKGYVAIRTGLSDLLKPLNSEYGVLLINNQSVLLPPEDEFDEYVANFLPYFFFGER